jgi:uncharacterized protein (DUF58 family)
MLTSRGWLFLVTVLAVAVLGLSNTHATLALVGLTLLSWFLGSWFWFVVRVRLVKPRLLLVRELRDERGPVDSLWVGWTFTVSVTIRNDSLFELPFVCIDDRVAPTVQTTGETGATGSLSRKQPLSVTYKITCPAPGRARFDGLGVQVADLQGFFHQRLFVRAVRGYRVLPAFADARGHIPTTKRHNLLPLLGIHAHRRPGTGSELLDLRDYLPGDPPKTIAWKVSARRGRLMTKVFESEVPIRCTLFVDTSNSVRVGGVGRNALARLVEIVAAVAQAGAGARDLTGLCLFDENSSDYVRPARGKRHLVQLVQMLADAAARSPTTAEAPVARLIPLAYSLALEVYPEFLHPQVNAMPFWLPVWAPQPAYTLRRAPRQASSAWAVPLLWLRQVLAHGYQALNQILAAPVSARYRQRYRWRKQLSALLSVRYGLAPGGLAVLLEDDELFSHYVQRFLAEHQVPYPLPWYDARGRYLFASPGKLHTLSEAFLQAVARGRDNELFVILADLLELGDELGQVLSTVKVALARHHQVMIICPWPPELPLPARGNSRRQTAGRRLAGGDNEPPSTVFGLSGSPSMEKLVRRATTARFHRAYLQLRRSFARIGVPVLCARDDDPIPLILDRLERLRVLERGMP